MLYNIRIAVGGLNVTRFVILNLLFLGFLVACSNDEHYEFAYENPSGYETYTISRRGEFYPEQDYGVIFVYGSVDNGGLAKEITDYLNESDPDAYHSFRHEQ